jgi:hypothetical protein
MKTGPLKPLRVEGVIFNRIIFLMSYLRYFASKNDEEGRGHELIVYWYHEPSPGSRNQDQKFPGKGSQSGNKRIEL